ncbi:uncharacterized protein [Coffea arabica]|uniref:Uncharacterized protein isoform X2 n=1 Tax=Coffea arabica TaxID=13443 RepID=A0ABM4VSC6_COFAR
MLSSAYQGIACKDNLWERFTEKVSLFCFFCFSDIMGIVLCVFPAREVYFEGGPSIARDYAIFNYEACVTLMITDETRSLNPVAMGDKAEKLIGISVHRLFQAEQENVHLTDRVASELEGKVLLCYVKHSNDVIRAVKGAPYTIVTVYGANEIGSNTC